MTDVNNATATIALSITVTPPLFTLRNLGDIGNVAVMEFTGNYDATKPDGSIYHQPRQAIAKEYFKTHGDLDFLVMLSNFDYAMPEVEVQGFYIEVKNNTQGIGKTPFDNSALFGSTGTLQGSIDLGNVTALAASPYGPKLDQTLNILNHELMHRFGANVRYKNPDGSLNTALLGKDGNHWSYLLDSKGSLLYGNGWKDNGNGTFISTAAMSAYSPLDLYLMGMIQKEQVAPMLLIDNPAIDKTQLPQLGATITGTAKTVTIDDIIAAEGARAPDATASQKQFKVGYVLLTRPEDSPESSAQAIETVRKAFAGRFAELTQRKGSIGNVPASLEVVITSPADGAVLAGPDVTVIGTIVNSTGATTSVTVNGLPATVNGNTFVIDHLPLQTGSNNIVATATDVNGQSATASRNVTATTGYSLGSVPGLVVGIASPSEGAIIIGPDCAVSGVIINASGNETGVIVNGVVAMVTCNAFIANHVPLQEGSNSVTVTATDITGLTATATRTVTAQSGNYIRLMTNIESGTAPLEITLRIDGSFPVDDATLSYPDTPVVVPMELADPEDYGFRITEEGTYVYTAEVVGPDGQTYRDTVTITVVSRQALETLLKGKWEGMKTAIINGTPEIALNYFVPGIQDRFRAIFADPEIDASARLSEISRIEVFTAKGRVVQAGAIRMESDGEYAYPVNFVKDAYGGWKILGF